MSQTTMLGTRAAYRWLTDECRRNRGDTGAISEALETLRHEAEVILRNWPADRGMRLHFVLTLERPPAPQEVCPECGGRGGFGNGGYDQHGEWTGEMCYDCGGTGRRPAPAEEGDGDG